MRRFALVLLALAGGAALALGPASPAHAHAVLESSVPAGSSVLDTAPTDITLDFDEPVTVEPGAIRLLDSAGKQITLGAPERGTDASVVVSSVPDLKDGAYVVAWQVISQDGHPASGAFTFQVGRAGGTDTRGLLASVLDQQRGDGAVQQLATFNRLLTYTGLALTLGGAAFAVAIWPSASRRWAARRLIWFGWGLLLLATVSTLVVAGALPDRPLAPRRARPRRDAQHRRHPRVPHGRGATAARAPRHPAAAPAAAAASAPTRSWPACCSASSPSGRWRWPGTRAAGAGPGSGSSSTPSTSVRWRSGSAAWPSSS